MTLSISKLQNLLIEKGYVPNKYFTMDGTCFYIEVFSIKTADIFFLYIPSKYNFRLEGVDNIFKLKFVKVAGGENTEDYTGAPNNDNLAEIYGSEPINLTIDKEKLREHLEENYKYQIFLNEISKEDSVDLKAIYRQVCRLKFCVQNINYKLGVMYKNYITSIQRDDTVECMFVKHYSRDDTKKLMIIVDLETFYANSNKIMEDVKIVRTSVYKVLEKNQGMHTRVIEQIMENNQDIATIPDKAHERKEYYDTLIDKLENMLLIMNNAEEEAHLKINILNEGQRNLQTDISNAHQHSILEKEIDKIVRIKTEITKNMISLQTKRETTILDIDKIMFDNTIMLDRMLKNFVKLREFFSN